MFSRRPAYTFVHDRGCLSFGITRGEYVAAHALIGLVKDVPDDTYSDSKENAEKAFWYVDEMSRVLFNLAGNFTWELVPAFPSNKYDGAWDHLDFPGLSASDWIAAKLLTTLTRSLSPLNGSYFVKPFVKRVLEYTDALLQLLSTPPSVTAYSYKKEGGLTFRDRAETRILGEVISYLPEPLKTDDISDVIRSARSLTESEPVEFKGGTIARFFAEQMSPWLIHGLEPHTTTSHIYRFASQLSEKVGLNPTDPALPVIRYHKRQDGGRQPIVVFRGLTIRAWIAGNVLGDLVCQTSTRFPENDVVDRALTYADSLLSEYMDQGFDVDPGDPSYPLQIARCRGNACTYEHSNGLDAVLWLASQLMGSLARRDVPDTARAAKYAIYQAHALFLESGRRKHEAETQFDPKPKIG